MRLLLLLCLGVTLPSALSAGPWPRETGTGFMSASVELWESNIPDLPNYFTNLYVEYGLTERLSFVSTYEMGSQSGSAFDVGLGILLWSSGPHVLSLEITAGEGYSHRFTAAPELQPPDDDTASYGSLGLGYGRGFALADYTGWTSALVTRTVPLDGPQPSLGLSGESWALDLTLGMTVGWEIKLLGQVFLARSDTGQESVKWAPGLAIPIGSRNHLEIGARLPRDDTDARALALGLWQTF